MLEALGPALYASAIARAALGVAAAPELGYRVDAARSRGRVCVHVTRGIASLDLANLRALAAVARVLDVRVLPATREIVVEFASSAVVGALPPPRTYAPQGEALERHVPTDFARVPSRDDQRTLDALTDAVYGSVDAPEDMVTWFEPVRARVATRAAPPHDDGDASASETADDSSIGGDGDAHATAPAIGFTLVFARVPHLTYAFLEHLAATHTAAIASMRIWLVPPASVADTPLLVVNVRAAATSLADTTALASRLPRGGLVVETSKSSSSCKRARVN